MEIINNIEWFINTNPNTAKNKITNKQITKNELETIIFDLYIELLCMLTRAQLVAEPTLPTLPTVQDITHGQSVKALDIKPPIPTCLARTKFLRPE